MEIKEVWKNIIGYENIYQISNLGRLKRLSRIDNNNHKREELILNPAKDKDGYIRAYLFKDGTGKKKYVHRLVAQAFIPNPDNLPQLNHKDENKTNNCVSNLEWCTQKYNNNYGTRTKRGLLTKKINYLNELKIYRDRLYNMLKEIS